MISGISNDLKKLDRYFSETTVFALVSNHWALAISGLVLAATSLELRPAKRLLYLKDDQLAVTALSGFPALIIFCSSLLNCHKLPEDPA